MGRKRRWPGSKKMSQPSRSAAQRSGVGVRGTEDPVAPPEESDTESPYYLTISRLTVDKLGVKLYDKASAVVAELIANSYDADAENVEVILPLGIQLASRAGGELKDVGPAIVVKDDGHGMTPDEARKFFLRVGADRRTRKDQDGTKSRLKKRPVMGRKGIGKLAPFGICRRIEVWSAGGPKTSKGYKVTHFFMDFEKILTDEVTDVPLEVGDDDEQWAEESGTKIMLSQFLAKRVPDQETFLRQLAVRFIFAHIDFKIRVLDAKTPNAPIHEVKAVDIPVWPQTRVDLADRPVLDDAGIRYPVCGWLAMAKEAYKYEETAGVRIYARNKIVGVTRDFNQPAGFTGEFAMRSYLVGEVHAEWLDLDDGEDLIRTDRQDILWDSNHGQLLRSWGAELIKEIARKSREPRRARVRDQFLKASDIERRAKDMFGDKDVARVAIELAKQLGGFAAEDELTDADYVDDMSQIILTMAPHRALMEAFREFSEQAIDGDVSLDNMLDIFDKAELAELASYAQIAAQRVRVIKQLEQVIDDESNEEKFQELIASAPWLIEPSWTAITKNQSLKTFKTAFEKYWKKTYRTDVKLAIDQETKRPDFTLVSIDGLLHIVEIKKAEHRFNDADCERLINYVDAFQKFFEVNKETVSGFYRNWQIILIADGVNLKVPANKHAYDSFTEKSLVKRMPWQDFLTKAKKVHEEFLNIHELGSDRRKKSAA